MEKIIDITESSCIEYIFGVKDEKLKFLEKEFGVNISLKPQGLCVGGSKDKVRKASNFIEKLLALKKEGVVFSRQELAEYVKSSAWEENEAIFQQQGQKHKEIGIKVSSARRKFVLPKTKGQGDYIKSIREYDMVFSIGPAGTGKTYLAMAMAVNYLINKKVRRIILARPAIEAGESLGFLPGDMYEKLGPYLRPLYDAIYDMMEVDVIDDYLDTGVIEIVPLAYMRGRTLNNAFVILDEAQNCTSEQLKMFLTRLGFDSKTVITGDITQSDLPGGKPIGLIEAVKILKRIREIKFVNLTKKDVVRHPLIQKVIQAYEDFYSEKAS
ncbi:MAG: PhoH family protein [Candidatus Omnitrophota bacterium]|nr:MAG: PhoH family protein [Candidatus Omnitrophota bacterium]